MVIRSVFFFLSSYLVKQFSGSFVHQWRSVGAHHPAEITNNYYLETTVSVVAPDNAEEIVDTEPYYLVVQNAPQLNVDILLLTIDNTFCIKLRFLSE